jgi:chromosome segregation ATPase
MGLEQMIVRQERNSGRAPAPGPAAARLSEAVLQAALEVAHQDRIWLEQKLLDQKTEQEALQGEIERLREILNARELAAKASSEQAEAATAEVSRLAGRLATLGQERDALRQGRNALVIERDEAARERDAIAQEQARLLEEAAREFHGLLIERDYLTSEIGFLRSEALPGRDRHDSDMRELSRTLEVMAQSLAAVQTWTSTAKAGEQRSDSEVIMLEARLRSLLAPLASLADLRSELARLSDRVEALAESVGPTATWSAA